MGCWNGSCMISGLPIRDGEKAVAIPMVRHPNGDLTVTFFPLFGEYNDGGSLMNIESNEYSSRLVELVLAAGSHDKKKDPAEVEDPSVAIKAKEIGKRIFNGEDVSEDDRDIFMGYILAREKASGSAWEKPVFWFGSQWEYSFAKGEEIQNEEDLVQIMEREFVRNNTFQVRNQDTWMPVIMNLIHRDVWDAFAVPENTRFMQENATMKLFREFGDSAMSRRRIAKEILEAVGMHGYGYTYTPLFGLALFGDIVTPLLSTSEPYPKPLLDLYQLGRMLYSLRRDLCLPAQGGSQSADYPAVKKLAEAMLSVVGKQEKEDI